MKNTLKKIFFGVTLPQEYLCVDRNNFENPLKLFVKNEATGEYTDITRHHLMNGYSPLIFTVDKNVLCDFDFDENDKVCFYLMSNENNKIAFLEVRFIQELKLDSTSCIIFEGVKGVHSFTNILNKFFTSIYYNITADRKKNIFLAGNLYDQVKIAYSIPRPIYLVSVGSAGLFNIFPTDLSGPIGENNFIVSLRTTGKANQQVIKESKCLVAEMDSDSFIEVYNSGRNHMKDLSEAHSSGILLRDERSTSLKLPVPLRAAKYYELEKTDENTVGIHTLHFSKIINTVILHEGRSMLAHIHREYAEWRIKRGFKTNYLLRKN